MKRMLMVMKGKQRVARMRPMACAKHSPGGRVLEQGDLLTGKFSVPCTCARKTAREWWVVVSYCANMARNVCDDWPELSQDGVVVEHGKNGECYRSGGR